MRRSRITDPPLGSDPGRDEAKAPMLAGCAFVAGFALAVALARAPGSGHADARAPVAHPVVGSRGAEACAADVDADAAIAARPPPATRVEADADEVGGTPSTPAAAPRGIAPASGTAVGRDGNAAPLARRVRLDVSDAPLSEVLAELERQSGADLRASDALAARAPRVTLRADGTLEDVLARLMLAPVPAGGVIVLMRGPEGQRVHDGLAMASAAAGMTTDAAVDAMERLAVPITLGARDVPLDVIADLVAELSGSRVTLDPRLSLHPPLVSLAFEDTSLADAAQVLAQVVGGRWVWRDGGLVIVPADAREADALAPASPPTPRERG